MIVKNPIGSVKVGNSTYRLTIGKPVPAAVLEFWKSTGQIESLKKSGAISDSENKTYNSKGKFENNSNNKGLYVDESV